MCRNAQIGVLYNDKITIINRGAFWQCYGLKGVSLPNVEAIESCAFLACVNLSDIDLGNKLESIGERAFSGCSKLEKLYLPDCLKYIVAGINDSAFNYCTGLKEISIGGVEELKGGIFLPGSTGSSVLEKITIRGSVKKIGDLAFTYNGPDNAQPNSSFAEIIIEEGVEEIGRKAFYGCKNFVSITLPSTIKSIGDYALEGCTNLSVHLNSTNEIVQTYLSRIGKAYDFIIDAAFHLTLLANGGTVNGQFETEMNVPWQNILSLPQPVWEGHVFSGWYNDEALTKRWILDTMPAEDLTLYAAWDLDVYTLTLNLMGGSAAQTTYSVLADSPIDVNIPSKEGFSFVGWSLDEVGEILFAGTMPAHDTTLYARWKELPV